MNAAMIFVMVPAVNAAKNITTTANATSTSTRKSATTADVHLLKTPANSKDNINIKTASRGFLFCNFHFPLYSKA
jgi:YbbR domain-containing protein